MAMLRLMYASVPTEAGLHAVGQIRDEAAARNRRLGITGLLGASPQRFFQVLEGEVEAVRRLYAAIARDSRHRDCRVLLEEPPAFRLWPAWGMQLVSNARLSVQALNWGIAPSELFGGQVPADILVGIMYALTPEFGAEPRP